MTRDDSIRTKTWVTNDGRYLTVDMISAGHLLRIEELLRNELTPGYDEIAGREIARDFVAAQERLLDDTIDLDLDAFRSAWLQILEDEFTRRGPIDRHENTHDHVSRRVSRDHRRDRAVG